MPKRSALEVSEVLVPEPLIKKEPLESPIAKKRRTEETLRSEDIVKSGASQPEPPEQDPLEQTIYMDSQTQREVGTMTDEAPIIEIPVASTSKDKGKKPQEQQNKDATVAELPKKPPTRLPFTKHPGWRPPVTTADAVRECNNFVTQSQMRLRDYIYGVVNEGYELIRTIEANLTWREVYEFHTRNGVMFRFMNELLDLALNCTAPPAIRRRNSGYQNYYSGGGRGGYRPRGRRGRGGGGW